MTKKNCAFFFIRVMLEPGKFVNIRLLSIKNIKKSGTVRSYTANLLPRSYSISNFVMYPGFIGLEK